MKTKTMLIVIATLILCAMLNLSIASSHSNHDLSLYIGEKINLKEYLKEQSIDFDYKTGTVIQNLNAHILTIESSYWVKAHSAGTGTLILNNGDELLSINITIETPIESITMDQKNITLLLGEKQKLQYTVNLKDASTQPENIKFKWKSNNPHVASIDDTNTIITKAAGRIQFVGTTLDNSYSVTLDLTVLAHSGKINVFSENRISKLYVGEKLPLTATLGTKDVSSNLTWESLTPHILSVNDQGVVTAVGEGIGEVVAKTTNKQKDTYKITTQSMIDKIELKPSRIAFNSVGETRQLQFNLYPKDKNNPPLLRGYRYTTSNPQIATVSSTGLITAKGPGTALISIIFDDSQKKATCTVEVPENFRQPLDNYIPIKSINLQPVDKTILLGDKQLLKYTVLPKNATDDHIKFVIPNGDDGQIKYIDNAYYFIPNKIGNIEIEVIANNNATDKITVSVTSPIQSLNLSLQNKRATEPIFLSETVELITKVQRKSGYTLENIYPTTLVYTIEDSSIARLVTKNNHYFITGLKAGTTKIEVKTTDSLKKDTLLITVKNPLTSISTDNEVELPIKHYYRPRVFYSTSDTTKNLNLSSEISEMINLSVDSIYLDEDFIDSEIAYEKSRAVPENENHRIRLNTLLSLKSKVVNNYALMDSPTQLKNRNGYPYKFYTVDHNRLIAYQPCKLNVSLKLNNTSYTTSTSIIWHDNTEVFNIKRHNTSYSTQDLITLYSLSSTMIGLNKQQKVDALISYINHIELFDSSPNKEVLLSLYSLEDQKELTALLSSLDDKVTKRDLALVSLALHKKYVNKNAVFTQLQPIYYYDVVEENLKKAISLEYILPENQYRFGTSNIVSKLDFMNMLKKILPNHTLTTSSKNQPLDHEQLIILLGQLIKS